MTHFGSDVSPCGGCVPGVGQGRVKVFLGTLHQWELLPTPFRIMELFGLEKPSQTRSPVTHPAITCVPKCHIHTSVPMPDNPLGAEFFLISKPKPALALLGVRIFPGGAGHSVCTGDPLGGLPWLAREQLGSGR